MYLETSKYALPEIQERYFLFKVSLNKIHNIKLGEESSRNTYNLELETFLNRTVGVTKMAQNSLV